MSPEDVVVVVVGVFSGNVALPGLSWSFLGKLQAGYAFSKSFSFPMLLQVIASSS